MFRASRALRTCRVCGTPLQSVETGYDGVCTDCRFDYCRVATCMSRAASSFGGLRFCTDHYLDCVSEFSWRFHHAEAAGCHPCEDATRQAVASIVAYGEVR